MDQTEGRFIFLAEDDIDDQELLVEALLQLDTSLQIHVEDSGEKAIDFLQNLDRKQTPCLIILDYNLPKVNGYQILNYLKSQERFHEVKKVVWSTSNSPQYEQSCLKEGALAYLVKPSDLSGIERIAQIMLQYCE
jgi:CheY-like chemotaxis protein